MHASPRGGQVAGRESEPWNDESLASLWKQIQEWAAALGFSQITVADIDLQTAEPGLLAWLAAGFAGDMDYLHRHGLKRLRPAELVPGTVRVLCVRMDYRPADRSSAPESADDWRAVEWARLHSPREAVVSLYARGRDYHKVLRQRLERLAQQIQAAIGPLGYRAFVDSAPVAEVELAHRSGLGWRGKHTLLLHPDHGSLFFLGELFVDLPLPVTPPQTAHCGRCEACLAACPTGAIVAPYRLDARRCISYLTIESDAPIPLALRRSMGNRIYGCDDCQLVCPWNKFAQRTTVPDFAPRHHLEASDVLSLWAWSESDFLQKTEGSAIRRIGWQRWRRNLAVALGNALASPALSTAERYCIADALKVALAPASALVAEHIQWALEQIPTELADQQPTP